MKTFILLVLVAATALAQKGPEWNFNKNIPRWVRAEIGSNHLQNDYNITYQLYPPILKGDFNGDKRGDVALLVQEKSSGKFGIAIFHASRPQSMHTRTISIVGAGHPIGKAGDDLAWVNVWKLLKHTETVKGLELEGDAIQIERRDSTSGIVFWNGKSYEWLQRKK